MNRIAIFDLDGTLADVTHRLHFLEEGKWDEFYLACNNDKPIDEIIALSRMMWHNSVPIFTLTGRSDIAKDKTIRWLNENNVLYDELFMRQDGDYSHAEDLKEKWINEIGANNIYCAFDDSAKVCNMFKRNGIITFHVNIGDNK